MHCGWLVHVALVGLHLMEGDSSSSDDGLPSFSFRARCAEMAATALLPHEEDLIVLGSEPSTSSRSAAAAVGGSSRSGPNIRGGKKRNVSQSVANGEKVSGKRGRPKADARESPVERTKRKREEEKQAAKRLEQERRELEKQRRELEKERARLEKERARDTRQKEKDLDRALKTATKEGSKDNSPAHRLGQMVVVLDSTNASLMELLAPNLRSLSVECRLSTCDEPGVVRWRRKVTEREVDERAQVLCQVVEEEEEEVLLTMEAQGFMGLVHHSKQALMGNPVPEGVDTLESYVKQFCTDNPGKRVSLAVQGIEAFLRGHKTRVNRQFRQAVLDSDPSSSSGGSGSHAPRRGLKRVPMEAMFSDVSRVECEEALVRLQLQGGCMTHMCEEEEQLVRLLVTTTKAISESHYQKENPFSFYTDSGQGPSKKDLDAAGNKVALIWQHQLMQFSQLSSNVAAAVVALYPSPAHLLQAYQKCKDEEAAKLLLTDITVRRGAGVTSTTRKLGPVQSKRVHSMLTSTDPSLKLP